MTEGKTTFEGTPCECVAWLGTHFSMMRKIAEGARDVELREAERLMFDDMLDALDRSVYVVTVEPMTGMVAKQRCRDQWLPRVTRMETGLELFDLLTHKESETKDE